MSARVGRSRTIVVLAFDGISPFHLSVPFLVFGEDRSEDGVQRFDVVVCAERPGTVRTSAGFSIQVERGLDALARAGTAIVPSWHDDCRRPGDALLGALRQAHARGTRVVGLCLGAFAVAEAGLLDGQHATTHWRWAAEFARRFPAVKLDPKVLYVDEGSVVTSAGTAAAIDCCLHLLRSQLGAEIANRVARRIVVAPHRQGGQAQYVETPLTTEHRVDELTRALEWARQHLDEDLGVDCLAARALMSRRTFTRRFRSMTGTTVTQWLIAERVALAQRMLETTDLSLERVAAAAGFGSALSFRQHFARSLRTSPSAYRRAFGGEVRSGGRLDAPDDA